MTKRLVLSLHCLNENNRLIAAYHDGLILESFTNPINENALWRLTYHFSRWILINQGSSSIHLTFNTKSKVITSADENNRLVVKDGDYRLRFRLSASAVSNNLALELFLENDFSGKASTVFFVCKESNEILGNIDRHFFNSGPTRMTTIADVVDNDYDYVVIGSSFCSLSFIHQILQNDPEAKILILEKGLKYLHEHHQHCSSPSRPREVEFQPWTIDDETLKNEYVQNLHGQISFFGGRSTFWSGWSPTPSDKEMAGWPQHIITALQGTYFHLANKFLGVVTANNIDAYQNNTFLYRTFQSQLKQRLDSAGNIQSVEQILHAPLAMGNNRSIKFSTPSRLLAIENVTVIYGCTVEKILHDGKKAIALQTSQGIDLPLKQSKLILAMSTLPATTLVLNSFKSNEFPRLDHVGKRFTAHFVSSLVARLPRQSLTSTNDVPKVELGAVYISGMKEQAQYHLQLSGVAYTKCKDDTNIYQICKKYSANSIPRECIDTSQDSVVVSCSTLGELDYNNKSNQFYLINNDRCLTNNGELKYRFNEQDEQLWNEMDSVTFDVMNRLSSSTNNDDLQYWHEKDKTWKKDTPPKEQIRSKSFVHDASTMWIGNDEDTEAPVDPNYRLRGVDNLYITGGALWPTGGSWNPVLTIVAMAMHLADTLSSIHQNNR